MSVGEAEAPAPEEETVLVKVGFKEGSFLSKLPLSLLELLVKRIFECGCLLVELVLRDDSIFEMKLREKYGAGNASNVSGRPLPGSLPPQLPRAQAPLPQAGTQEEARRAELIYEFMFERLSKEGQVYEDDVLKHVYGRDSQALDKYEVWRFRKLLDNVVRKRLERALGDLIVRAWDVKGRAIYMAGEVYRKGAPPRRTSKTEVVEEVALSLASKSDAFTLKELVERCIEEFRRRGLPVSPQEDDTVRSLWKVVRRRVERRLGISLEERREGNRKVYRVVRGGVLGIEKASSLAPSSPNLVVS
jgi:hypothetical protein